MKKVDHFTVTKTRIESGTHGNAKLENAAPLGKQESASTEARLIKLRRNSTSSEQDGSVDCHRTLGHVSPSNSNECRHEATIMVLSKKTTDTG